MSEEIALQKARMAESRVGAGSMLDIKDAVKEVIDTTEDDEDEEDLATSNVICMEDRTGEVIHHQQLLDMAYNVKLYEKDADDAVEGPEIKVLFVPEEEDEEWDKVMEETKAGDKSQETIRLETDDDIVIVDLDEDSDAEEEDDGKPRAVKRLTNERDEDDDDLEDDRDLIAALESKINLIQRKASDDRLEQDDGSTAMSFEATAENAKSVVRGQSIAGSIDSIGGENVSVVSEANRKRKPPPSSSDSRKSLMPSKKQITTKTQSKTSDRQRKKVSQKGSPPNAQKSPVWKSPSRWAKTQQKKKTDGTETKGSGHVDNKDEEDEDDDDYVNRDDEEEKDDHMEDRERDYESHVSDKYSQKWVNK